MLYMKALYRPFCPDPVGSPQNTCKTLNFTLHGWQIFGNAHNLKKNTDVGMILQHPQFKVEVGVVELGFETGVVKFLKHLLSTV